MYLPNASESFVSIDKVTNYLLNRNHPEGGSKASFFESLGFSYANISVFIEALKDIPRREHVSNTIQNQFGTKYIIDGILKSPNSRNPQITTVWIIEHQSKIPKLVTAYPKQMVA